MQVTLAPLLPLYERERRAGRALVLGVLVHTRGSTYQKPGALILIAADGDYAGLISGGCLEGDLREHARAVLADGQLRSVNYDLEGPEELLWGLGLGCQGSMRIVLLRAGPENDWQPLGSLAAALAAHRAAAVGIVCAPTDQGLAPGAVLLAEADTTPAGVRDALRVAAETQQSGWFGGATAAQSLFLLSLALPPRILLLGAGPDAVPVVDLAARLGWKLTLADHRPAYAVAAHFPAAERVLCTPAAEVARVLALEAFAAAIVMSHHLPSDLAYLRVLAASRIPYVGLLGPRTRRDRLLADLGREAGQLRERLHAPVGLPLGGRSPESIALAIVAELHAFLHGPESLARAPGRATRAPVEA